MNEKRQPPDAAKPASAVSRTTVVATDILQALLLICVVGWVLDIPRRAFGLAFYTEQLLAVCMGLALALCFIGGVARRPSRIDWGGAIASFGIAAYLVYRFAMSAPNPSALIACLGVTLVWTIVGSRAWAMRWFDWIAAALSLVTVEAVADTPLGRRGAWTGAVCGSSRRCHVQHTPRVSISSTNGISVPASFGAS